MHTAEQLAHTQSQRLSQLRPNDMIRTLDWNELQSSIHLIHAAWDAQATAMHAPIPASREAYTVLFTCQWCHQALDSVPNFA